MAAQDPINEIIRRKTAAIKLLLRGQERYTKNPTVLYALMQAKAYSDLGDYKTKNEILRLMLSSKPNEFIVDSVDDNGSIIGLTHMPSNFRIHTTIETVNGIEPIQQQVINKMKLPPAESFGNERPEASLVNKTAARNIDVDNPAAYYETNTPPATSLYSTSLPEQATPAGVFSKIFNKWKHLPIPLRIATALAAIGATTTTLSALTLGTAYLINKKWLKRKIAQTLDKSLDIAATTLEKGSDKLPSTKYKDINVQGSLSLTGPGIAFSYKHSPLVAKLDLGGGGVLYKFYPDKVLKWLKNRELIDKDKADYYAAIAPPEMYAGLELAAYPFAAGVLVDKSNAAETAKKLRLIQKELKTKKLTTI
jgi:hypothetical protein